MSTRTIVLHPRWGKGSTSKLSQSIIYSERDDARKKHSFYDIKMSKDGRFILVGIRLFGGKLKIVDGTNIEEFYVGNDGKFTEDSAYLIGGDSCNLKVLSLSNSKTSSIIKLCKNQSADVVYSTDWIDAVYNDGKILVANNYNTKLWRLSLSNPANNSKVALKSLIYVADENEPPYNGGLYYQGGFTKDSTSVNLNKDIVAGGVGLNSETAKIYRSGEPSVGWVRTFSTGKIKYQLVGQEAGIYQTAISSDGKYLATRSNDSVVNHCTARPDFNTPEDPFGPKDPLGDSTLALRDASDGKIITIYAHACYGPIFSKDSKKLMYSDYKYNLHIVTLR